MYRLAVLLLLLSGSGRALPTHPGQAAPAGQRKAARPARPAPSTPAPATQAPSRWPVEQVEVEGLRNFNRQAVLDILALEKGRPADKAAFEAARDRLSATGAFGSIAYRYAPSASGAGYTVTFEVVEVEQIYPYRFERLPAPDNELRDWLRQRNPMFNEKIPATKTLVEAYSRQIGEFLEKKGEKVEVRGKLTTDQPGELFVLFHPEGAPPVVARVEFVGNKVLPTEALQRAIRGVAVGTEYREDRFRQLLDTSVRPLYEARGRLRAAFPEVKTEAAGDVKGIAVTVSIQEGDSFSLGKTEVRGVAGQDAQLARAANLKEGDLADFTQVSEGLERIRKLMRANGYMRVTSTLDRSLDDEKKAVDLLVTVEPGPRYLFGKLILRGLDIHGEAEVKRLWSLEPGQPFKGDYPDFFLAQLHERAIFENLGKTRSELGVDDKGLSVDVTLIFSKPEPEGPPGAPGRPPGR